MKSWLIILIFISSHFSAYASGAHAEEKGEAGCSERMSVLLKEYPKAVIVHVKGLVCSSCAIGIRIGLAKLDGLDRSQFTKGVELDSTNQYVLLAKEGDLNFNQVFEKIYKAGYDPLHLCYMQAGQVVRVEAPERS
jgi:copper chaperone CopZ